VTLEKLIRPCLWLSAVFNLGGALLFAFPASRPGQFVGLPGDVPLSYRALLTMFVLLFGGVYGWLACQAKIDRALLALGAIGKACAFLIILVLWIVGQATSRGLLAGTGDLIFASLFTAWLVGADITEPSGSDKVTQ
jgi:hypothetical protein